MILFGQLSLFWTVAAVLLLLFAKPFGTVRDIHLLVKKSSQRQIVFGHTTNLMCVDFDCYVPVIGQTKIRMVVLHLGDPAHGIYRVECGLKVFRGKLAVQHRLDDGDITIVAILFFSSDNSRSQRPPGRQLAFDPVANHFHGKQMGWVERLARDAGRFCRRSRRGGQYCVGVGSGGTKALGGNSGSSCGISMVHDPCQEQVRQDSRR
jgi:hypothetical protein